MMFWLSCGVLVLISHVVGIVYVLDMSSNN